ncbi:MAG: hypothetical protein H7240_04095 [Glaciimonas sp.]|nr:hypothetical protein [Glaciimonas sp.]
MFFVLVVVVVFGLAALRDIREEKKRTAKTYKNPAAINDYMFALLQDSGHCEICSRDASWITDSRIYALLVKKAKRGELTFLVHKSTQELLNLKNFGADIVEYGSLGFDPITRFTIVNAGNSLSSYVAVGRRKPQEMHTIEELDSSHPTYSMAHDLIRCLRIANDNFKKNQKPDQN